MKEKKSVKLIKHEEGGMVYLARSGKTGNAVLQKKNRS